MAALLKLHLLPQPIAPNTTSANGATDEIEIADLEETGYQASYSKLGASERARPDPVAHVAEPREYLASQLVAASQARPGQVRVATSIPRTELTFARAVAWHWDTDPPSR